MDPAAVPEAPSAPSIAATSRSACSSALFLGLGLAFFLDYLDNTLKTPEDVRHYLGVPLLGVIPE